MRSLPRNALLFGLGLFAGCLDYDPIDEDVCGNGVIEPRFGEDCDPVQAELAMATQVCRPPGTAGQCRIDCSVDSTGTKRVCPDRWGCGADDICREPIGDFVLPGTSITALAGQLQAADFDGDGSTDLLTAGPTGLQVLYFSATGVLEDTFTLSIDDASAAVGQLTDNALSDIAVKTLAGIGVLRGRSDRTLSPTVYSSESLPVLEARTLGIDVLPTVKEPGTDNLNSQGDEPLAIVDEPPLMGMQTGRTRVISVDFNIEADPVTLADVTGNSVKDLGDEIPVGQINEHPLTSPCEELVLAFNDSDSVLVVTPCILGPDGVVVLNDFGKATHLPPTKVMLADGTKIAGGARLFDLNLDGHLDLAIGSKNDAMEPTLQTAFGRGDGTFDSDGVVVPPELPDNKAVVQSGLAGVSLPLALGYLNADLAFDFVLDGGVYLSSYKAVADGTGGGGGGGGGGDDPSYHYEVVYQRVAAPSVDLPWTHARIADFNGNLIPDVIAVAGTETGVVFLSGAGGDAFNRFTIPTQGTVQHVAVGDFDGDVLLDLAIAERITRIVDGETIVEDDALSVLFGRLSDAPDAPVTMGRLPVIQQLTEAKFVVPIAGQAAFVDGISDIGVLSRDGQDNNLALIVGSTDRQLQSPFALTDGSVPGCPSVQNVLVRSVIGQFTDGDAHPDLAVLAYPIEDPGPDCPPVMIPADEYRLWLAQSSGEAVLKGTTSSSSDALFSASFKDAILVPVNLDGDQNTTDELAVFIPLPKDSQTAEARSELFIAESILGPEPLNKPMWVVRKPLEQAVRTSEELSHTASGMLPLWVGPASTAAADLDGDGLQDVVVMGVLESTDEPAGDRTETIVFWNDGAGGLDVEDRTRVPQIMGESVRAFALINAGEDLPGEIALVTSSGIYLAEVGVEGDPRGLAAPRLVVPSGGDAITVADMNGDGLDDLILGSGTDITIYRQKSRY